MKNILSILLIMIFIGGCQTFPQADGWEGQTPIVVELEQVIYWLQAANNAIELTPDQARQQLNGFHKMKKTRFNTFRYALLNQQLGTRDGWEVSRDTLRNLAGDKSNNEDLLWVVRIHLNHIQALINNHERHQKMAAELKDSRQTRVLLEDKIQAITNLEQSISERKEQVSEDVKINGEIHDQR